MTSLWEILHTQLAYLTASVQPLWSVRKFLLLVYFSSWVEVMPVLGCCPSLYVTLWIFHVSHTFQGSAKQTLFPFVGCSQGFQLKDIWHKPFLPFTKGFLNGCLRVKFMTEDFEPPATEGNCFTWLTNVTKMFGYNRKCI